MVDSTTIMDDTVPQAMYSCPAFQNYYRCYGVDYAGCCSFDPCDTGHCTGEVILVSSNGYTCKAAKPTPVNTAVTPQLATSFLTGPGNDMPMSESASIFQTAAVASSVQIATAGTDTSGIFTTATARSSVASAKINAQNPTSTQVSYTPPISAGTQSSDTQTTSTHPSQITVAVVGSVLGTASLIFIIILLLCCCCRRKKKVTFKVQRDSKKEQERKKQFEEVEKTIAEREKALAILEKRRTLPIHRQDDEQGTSFDRVRSLIGGRSRSDATGAA